MATFPAFAEALQAAEVLPGAAAWWLQHPDEWLVHLRTGVLFLRGEWEAVQPWEVTWRDISYGLTAQHEEQHGALPRCSTCQRCQGGSVALKEEMVGEGVLAVAVELRRMGESAASGCC